MKKKKQEPESKIPSVIYDEVLKFFFFLFLLTKFLLWKISNTHSRDNNDNIVNPHVPVFSSYLDPPLYF